MVKNKHQLLQFFGWQHLPEHLQEVSKPFGELAEKIDDTLPNNPEKTTALRKLLEAKDCAVRSTIWKEPVKEDVPANDTAATDSQAQAAS